MGINLCLDLDFGSGLGLFYGLGLGLNFGLGLKSPLTCIILSNDLRAVAQE